jgi:hypothetical protein
MLEVVYLIFVSIGKVNLKEKLIKTVPRIRPELLCERHLLFDWKLILQKERSEIFKLCTKAEA